MTTTLTFNNPAVWGLYCIAVFHGVGLTILIQEWHALQRKGRK